MNNAMENTENISTLPVKGNKGRPRKDHSLTEVVTFKISYADKCHYIKMAKLEKKSLSDIARIAISEKYGVSSESSCKGNLKDLNIQ